MHPTFSQFTKNHPQSKAPKYLIVTSAILLLGRRVIAHEGFYALASGMELLAITLGLIGLTMIYLLRRNLRQEYLALCSETATEEVKNLTFNERMTTVANVMLIVICTLWLSGSIVEKF